MPTVSVTEEIHARLVTFTQVLEALVDEPVSFDVEFVGFIIGKGIDGILAELVGPVEQATLIASVQQLGALYPAQVYGYIAEMLRLGKLAQEKEQARKHIGFRPRPAIE